MKNPITLVLDEHLLGVAVGLQHRGIAVRTVEDFGVKSTLDPDVIRGIASGMKRRSWVMVTMDISIIEDHPRFDWARYAIAWVVIQPQLRGVAVEQAKHEVAQAQARRMLTQSPGDHFTYTESRHLKHPPSLMTRRRALG